MTKREKKKKTMNVINVVQFKGKKRKIDFKKLGIIAS